MKMKCKLFAFWLNPAVFFICSLLLYTPELMNMSSRMEIYSSHVGKELQFESFLYLSALA